MLCGSWLSVAIGNVRARVREGGAERGAASRDSSAQRNSTSTHSLNRSYSSVFDGSSQFAPIRSISYVEGLPNPDALPPSGQQRTAIVGPHYASAYDGRPKMLADDASSFFGRRLRSDGDMEAVEVQAARRSTSDCHPSVLQTRRRSLQPAAAGVGGIYQISCVGSSPQCSALARDVRMPSSDGRLRSSREVHSNSTSSSTLVAADMSPTKQYSGSRRTLNNGVNAQLGNTGDQPSAPPAAGLTTPTSSRKMMVAPQPHCRSHPKDRLDDPYRDQHVSHRRMSGGGCAGAVVPLYSATESRRQRVDSVGIVQSPTSDQPFQYSLDERTSRPKPNGDVRVAVLEQRVRELEAAVIGSSSALTAAPSFIIPVVGNKSSRMMPSTSGQLVVSTVASTSQQLMAQEIVDKEVEIERLQSQLRKYYSRMETRQAQYEDEVNAFRRESEEAKAQLAKVKSRLVELEGECGLYREKAAAVETARNSAIAASVEKIAGQEKELTALREELEKCSSLEQQLQSVKQELEFLELQNDSLNATLDTKDALIRELEDSVFVMKMDTSCKTGSGSATPKTENFSLFDVEVPKMLDDLGELKERTPTLNESSTPLASAIRRSETCYQISSSAGHQMSALMSQLIRRILSTVLECRLLAKCLKDTASKAISGDAPSVNRLLGCTSDSMSESDLEQTPQLGAAPMSLNNAERCLRKGAEDLTRLEKDLNSLREKFIEYYQQKAAEELSENDACKIQ